MEVLRGRALALLEENLRRVPTTPRRPLDPDLVRTDADQAVVNVSVAFETLFALGCLTEEDREQFYARLRDVTTANTPFTGTDLERVVVAEPSPAEPALRLLAAELYRDGAVLRWVFVANAANTREHEPPRSFSLWDDADTAYTPWGGGWVSGHHLRGETTFVPRVPDDATRLYAAAGSHRYEIVLADRDDIGGAGPAASEPLRPGRPADRRPGPAPDPEERPTSPSGVRQSSGTRRSRT